MLVNLLQFHLNQNRQNVLRKYDFNFITITVEMVYISIVFKNFFYVEHFESLVFCGCFFFSSFPRLFFGFFRVGRARKNNNTPCTIRVTIGLKI